MRLVSFLAAEWRSVFNIVRKELLQLRRDTLRLRMMIGPPLLQLVLLGYAVNLDVRDVPLLVADADHSPQSRALVERFLASGYFTLAGHATTPAEIDRALDRGDASVALVIPAGFAANLLARRPAPVQAVADGSDAAFAARGISYAAMIAGRYSTDVLFERMEAAGHTLRPVGVAAHPRVWFNPGLDSRWFLIPGILVLVLMVIALVGNAMNVVREREIGTLEQLIVTPVRGYHLILGKLIPNALIGAVEAVLVLLVVRLVFDVPLRGSLALLFALTLLFLVSMQALGLFVSTVSRTQQQAMMTGIFFVMFPMILLSGFVFPIENMPAAIQAVTYLIPLRYFFEIVRGIFLKGVGMEVLWDETLALAAFTVAVLALSVMRFRKRLA